ISVEEQLGWRDDWQAWRRWREAVEAAGVLVFQFPKVPLAQVRGLSLLTSPLPVIGMNSKESAPGARVFTLLHELTHIALAVGQEEKAALGEPRDDAAWSRVERFAEETASAAIIPEESLAGFLRHLSVPRDAWDVQLVRSLATKFRVTPLAMATRLRAAGALTWGGYQDWKAAWGEHLTTLKPPSKGFATPVDKTLGRGGRPFAQLVIEALDSNRITAVQACRYLDLRFEHFEKLRSELREGPGAARTADDGD
ncbi:MAG: ImmA/IrrE family metallo-endopeptidase, partial [Burkholderiales bacterium]